MQFIKLLGFRKHIVQNFRFDVSTLAVAIIALGFSIWQGREQIKHNHVSVEPRFTSYFSNSSKEKQWGIYIINNGMGTGFVNELNVFVDGVEVPDHEWGKFYSAISYLKLNPLCFLFGGPRKNDSFKVGEEVFLIEAQPEDVPLVPKSCFNDRVLLIEYQKERLNYILEVKSIYGDEFKYMYSNNTQIKI